MRSLTYAVSWSGLAFITLITSLPAQSSGVDTAGARRPSFATLGLPSGTVVKVQAQYGRVVTGRILSWTPDTLVVGNALTQSIIPVGTVQKVFVRPPNRAQYIGVGSVFGALMGSLAAQAIHDSQTKPCPLTSSDCPIVDLSGGLGASFAGALVGGALGAGVIASLYQWQPHGFPQLSASIPAPPNVVARRAYSGPSINMRVNF